MPSVYGYHITALGIRPRLPEHMGEGGELKMKKSQFKTADDLAAFRYGVISPLVSRPEDYGSDSAFFDAASAMDYTLPDGSRARFSWHTVRKWYKAYLSGGLDALRKAPRSDRGKPRRASMEAAARVAEILAANRRAPSTEVLRVLRSEGWEMSPSTCLRLCKAVAAEAAAKGGRAMLRYEAARANDVWHGDSAAGFFIREEGRTAATRLWVIALIDDASRMVVSAVLTRHDDSASLAAAMERAALLYGVPSRLNFDNGANYRSPQIDAIAGRIGSAVHYCEPYAPTSKAKIERWFRTLKDHWYPDGCRTLDEAQASLDGYVRRYNGSPHSSLEGGASPRERWLRDREYVRPCPAEGHWCFLFREERRVSADCVAVVRKVEWQCPYALAGRKAWFAFEPDLSRCYAALPSGEFEELRRLDKVSNSQARRPLLSEKYGKGGAE